MWHHVADTHHKYTQRDATLYIWCAGTKGHVEWADNFRLRQKRLYNRFVNLRDYRAALELYKQLSQQAPVAHFNRIVCFGFSRGGAIAQILCRMLDEKFPSTLVEIHLFASKRSMSRVSDLRILSNIAYRGDIVPFLPPLPFYRLPPICWKGRFVLPWVAHNKAAHDAARVRHQLSAIGG
jgi:hypothetical protein